MIWNAESIDELRDKLKEEPRNTSTIPHLIQQLEDLVKDLKIELLGKISVGLQQELEHTKRRLANSQGSI